MTNEETRRRVWFITESRAAFGRALSEAVLARGDALVGTACQPEQLQDLEQAYPEQFLPLAVDVARQDQAQAAVQQAIKRFARIDVLVNDAGSRFNGTADEMGNAETLQVFKNNIFGPLHVTRAVLPFMQNQQGGHIFMHLSPGDLAGSVGFGVYNGNTFAIEGLSETLAREVVPLGIRLTIIEQGGLRANRTRCSLVRAQSKMVRHLQGEGNSPDDFAPAVLAIMKMVDLAQPPPRLVLGADVLSRL